MTRSSSGMSGPSRREFLKWSAAAALVGTLTPAALSACSSASDGASDAELDVAIIGGGPTGLYAAYRLLTGTAGSGSPLTAGKPRVAVFEATNRLGGRIWSVPAPGAPGLTIEYGGMRYLDTQEIVPRLIEALGLPSAPFTEGNGENLVYLRGKRFRESQYTDPSVIPYALPESEQGMTPAELMLKGMTDYVPGAARMSPAQWTTTKATARFDGQLLRDQGYWNLMQEALSPEGYALMGDGIGYPISTENWNAVETMQQMSADFGPGATYRTIPGGFMRLPLTLAALARNAGAAMHLQTKATTIEPAPGGGSRITLTDALGVVSTVTARRVILAIPSDPMRDLANRSALLQSGEFARVLGAVGTGPSSKLALAFDEAWWHRLNVVGGMSVTDLPVNRIVYFGPDGAMENGAPGNSRSLLLCYTDMAASEFWDGYQAEPDFNGPTAPREAPARMVRAALDQLSDVHGTEVPDPYWSGFIDWSNSPYGNAFHAWKVHADSGTIIPYLRNPFEGTGISVAVDCWSPSQDFIESGLTVAEGLLQETYGLEPPPWLPGGLGVST